MTAPGAYHSDTDGVCGAMWSNRWTDFPESCVLSLSFTAECYFQSETESHADVNYVYVISVGTIVAPFSYQLDESAVGAYADINMRVELDRCGDHWCHFYALESLLLFLKTLGVL